MERSELLESALESLPDGLAVLGAGGEVVCWNRAAESLTGFAAIDVVGRTLPEVLEELLRPSIECTVGHEEGHRFRLRLRHKQGHEIPIVGLRQVLRDGLGGRIGREVIFRPVQHLDALPHGESGGSDAVVASQQELEERLEEKYEDFEKGGEPFGVLWIAVDQADKLRRTHGGGACEAMLAKVQHAIAQGLRPGEEMGRWGADEFLVIAHERTAELLGEHAQKLTGLTRTADFRWWGDRVQLTASVGASQANQDEGTTLPDLLEQARKAMETSIQAGGNTITPPPGGKTCLPS